MDNHFFHTINLFLKTYKICEVNEREIKEFLEYPLKRYFITYDPLLMPDNFNIKMTKTSFGKCNEILDSPSLYFTFFWEEIEFKYIIFSNFRIQTNIFLSGKGYLLVKQYFKYETFYNVNPSPFFRELNIIHKKEISKFFAHYAKMKPLEWDETLDDIEFISKILCNMTQMRNSLFQYMAEHFEPTFKKNYKILLKSLNE